jgi:hypothetical protein
VKEIEGESHVPVKTATAVINNTGNGNCHPGNGERAVRNAGKWLQTGNLLLRGEPEKQSIPAARLDMIVSQRAARKTQAEERLMNIRSAVREYGNTVRHGLSRKQRQPDQNGIQQYHIESWPWIQQPTSASVQVHGSC